LRTKQYAFCAFVTLLILAIESNSSSTLPQPSYPMDEVVVTAARSPIVSSELARTVRVIRRSEIERAPVSSVSDLIGYALGVDLQTRGPNGAQADLALRGSSFEQALVLLNGIRMSDPQTGHHQLNLPVSLVDVERVEILYGHGSRLYGSCAIGGVVNIITRKMNGLDALVNLEAGDYGLIGGTASLSVPADRVQHSITIERRIAGNYVPSSELDLRGGSYGASARLGTHSLSLRTGWQDKRFGASTFYSNTYPMEWEATETKFACLADQWQSGLWRVDSRLSWRGHHDEYILDRTRPTFYHNNHKTKVIETTIFVERSSEIGVTTGSIEFGDERIESSSLKNHHRERWGVSLEQLFIQINKFQIVAGVSGYGYSDWDFEVYPGIDVACMLSNSLRLYGTTGGSFRVPTYTDLYYDSPANKGNPNLKPESVVSWELGAAWSKGEQRLGVCYYHRSGKDIIDWAREFPADPWRTMNVTNLETDGLETTISADPRALLAWSRAHRIELGFSMISSVSNFGGLISKYVQVYPRRQASLKLDHTLPGNAEASWFIKYKQITGRKSYAVTDLRLARPFGHIEIYALVNNCFNNSYEEIAFIPMPGRWIKAGLNWKLAVE